MCSCVFCAGTISFLVYCWIHWPLLWWVLIALFSNFQHFPVSKLWYIFYKDIINLFARHCGIFYNGPSYTDFRELISKEKIPWNSIELLYYFKEKADLTIEHGFPVPVPLCNLLWEAALQSHLSPGTVVSSLMKPFYISRSWSSQNITFQFIFIFIFYFMRTLTTPKLK